jgi:Zn-finger nucleic acid-binding protein
MKCPTDKSILQLSERHGIEIDYCPVCRGVWLDRGELDKIVERSGDELTGDRRPREERVELSGRHGGRPWGGEADDDYDDRRRDGGRPRKRRSFLDDLFDLG